MRTWEEQLQAEDDLRLKWLKKLAEKEPSIVRAAEVVGLDRSALFRMARRLGFCWPKPHQREKQVKPALSELTEEQQAEVTLLRSRGYRMAQAIAIVTAPRAKVSLYVKPDASQEPLRAPSRPQVAPLRVRLTANPQRACTGVSGGVR